MRSAKVPLTGSRNPCRADLAIRSVTVAALLVAAIVLTPQPARTDLSAMPQPTWMVNGPVYALAMSADRIFIGGNFTEIREQPIGGAVVPVRNLAAIDARTGEVIPTWNPIAENPTGNDGSVYALAVSPDGQTVYAGGAFTRVGGVKHNRLVAIDASSGAVRSWSPNVAWKVRAVAASSSAIYIGGDFQTVDGQARTRLAAFDMVTGSLSSSWAPSADGRVYCLVMMPGDAQVVVGGDFSTIGGVARRGLARVDASSGAVDPVWKPNITGPQTANIVFDAVATQDRVFTAVGGPNNFAAAYDGAAGSSGSQLWRTWADGDVQTIERLGTSLVIGGHFTTLDGASHVRLALLDERSGEDDLNWIPTLNSYYGAWDLMAHAEALFVGGEFTLASGVEQWRVAKFPLVDPLEDAVHEDDFESGDLSRWTGATAQMAVQGVEVHEGSYAARATSSGPATFAYRDLSQAHHELYWRVWVDVVSKGANKVGLGQFADPTGEGVLVIFVSAGGTLGLRNSGGATPTDTPSTQPVSPAAWHELEVHVTVAGDESRVEVWLDGLLIDQLTKQLDLGPDPIGRIYLGERVGGRVYDVVFDDHGLDDVPIS